VTFEVNCRITDRMLALQRRTVFRRHDRAIGALSFEIDSPGRHSSQSGVSSTLHREIRFGASPRFV
jgi:hypothetical protein